MSQHAPIKSVLSSGVAMEWAGWAKSSWPPSAGAPEFQAKKYFKIIFPLQWELGQIFGCELHKNAFGGWIES